MFKVSDENESSKPPGSPYTKPASPTRRRPSFRRRWVHIAGFILFMTLFILYFGYYYYYYYQHGQATVSAINSFISTVANSNSNSNNNNNGNDNDNDNDKNLALSTLSLSMAKVKHYPASHQSVAKASIALDPKRVFIPSPHTRDGVEAVKVEHEQVQQLTQPDVIIHPDHHIPIETWTGHHQARGVLYMIVRNENLPEARSTIRVIQDRFNDKAKYPWVLLNNQYFNSDFKKHVSTIVAHKNISIFFGKIDAEAWDYPYWTDVPRAENAIREMDVHRGDSVSHHQLLRYQAGLFFHHPLFKHADYSWRVEPGAMYSCELESDPFAFMKKEKKKIGFVLTTKEEEDAVQTLWSTTESFMAKYPKWIKPQNQTIMPWITRRVNNKDEYNYCHMWSNFEIADLSFLRSEAYQAYFDYLDIAGGFFYEKWGDPVRTLAAAMFLDRNQVHFFDEIGYTKGDIQHCPLQSNFLQKCTCNTAESHDVLENSCTLDLLRYIDPPTFASLMNSAKSSVPKQLTILDLNKTEILKQVIKKKDQLASLIKHQERLEDDDHDFEENEFANEE